MPITGLLLISGPLKDFPAVFTSGPVRLFEIQEYMYSTIITNPQISMFPNCEPRFLLTFSLKKLPTQVFTKPKPDVFSSIPDIM